MGTAANAFLFESDQIDAESELIASQARINAAYAEASAEDALLRGDKEAQDYRSKINQFVGTQRASIAANNIEVGSGTAAQLQDDTLRQGEIDLLTIKNNAYREAWGFETQANNITNNARIQTVGDQDKKDAATASGFVSLGNTALSGVAKLFGGV